MLNLSTFNVKYCHEASTDGSGSGRRIARYSGVFIFPNKFSISIQKKNYTQY